MNIFLLITLAMAIIILLMRRHFYVGICMLAGGAFIWLMRSGQPLDLLLAMQQTMTMGRTYDLIFSLYLVMCLEIALRTSGTLSRMVAALQRLFSSSKATLAIMPSFLGLLPSLGGARFSAPIVEEACLSLKATAEDKAAINFWFRHTYEFSNPIIPGMIMACSIADVPYASFASQTAWVTVLCFAVGWLVLLMPLQPKSSAPKTAKSHAAQQHGSLLDILLAIFPIGVTFLLVVFANLNASVAMGITTLLLYLILRCMGRHVSLKEMLTGSIDKKMFINVICILYFIQILTITDTLSDLVTAFQNAPLPIPVIIACISLAVGILTGMSQAHVAIVMPIVASLQTGSLTLAAIAMVFGVAGEMITPTHVCFTVTTDYFQVDFFTVLKKMALVEVIVLSIFSAVTYCLYYL